jgi:serine protease Do
VPGGFKLGVWIGDVGEALRAHLKLGPDEGALVEEVVPGSPAAKMGVKRLDVIRKANGVRVGSAEDLRKALAEVKEGGKIELVLIRKGDPLTLVGTR